MSKQGMRAAAGLGTLALGVAVLAYAAYTQVWGLAIFGAIALAGAFFVLPKVDRANHPSDPRKRKIRIVGGVMVALGMLAAGSGGDVAFARMLFFGGVGLFVLAWIISDQKAVPTSAA